MQVHKILVATDFSPASQSALKHAAAIATRRQAELHVLHVHELKSDWYGWAAKPDLARVDDIIEEAARASMQSFVGGETLPVVHSVVRDTRAAPAVLHYAQTHAIDLIVAGTHARKGPGGVLLGSVAAEITRISKRPVLVVGHGQQSPASGYRRMLVAVDLSTRSPALLHAAAALASESGATLQLVHVVDTHNMPRYLTGDFTQDQVTQAEQSLQALARDAGLADTADLRVLTGTAHEAIAALAEQEGSDLIMVGRAELSTLGRLMLGSSTRRLLRHAPCPVLAWREPTPEG